MTDFEIISHLIRFGLSFKKMSQHTIIEWADRKINEQTKDNLFFELSTAKSKNEVIELLSGKVIWNFNDNQIRIFILSYYKEYLKSNDWINHQQRIS